MHQKQKGLQWWKIWHRSNSGFHKHEFPRPYFEKCRKPKQTVSFKSVLFKRRWKYAQKQYLYTYSLDRYREPIKNRLAENRTHRKGSDSESRAGSGTCIRVHLEKDTMTLFFDDAYSHRYTQSTRTNKLFCKKENAFILRVWEIASFAPFCK